MTVTFCRIQRLHQRCEMQGTFCVGDFNGKLAALAPWQPGTVSRISALQIDSLESLF